MPSTQEVKEAAKLESFWKNDFAPLDDAGNAILHALREDELSRDADLYRRIDGSGSGAHRYFCGSGDSGGSSGSSGSGVASSSSAEKQHQLPSGPRLATPTEALKHTRSVPLPPFLAQQLTSVKMNCLMGLFPAAELAWLSVDDKLFLWQYGGASGDYSHESIHGHPSICSFTIPNGQCVVGVGLAHPKKGVFKSSVKWCLVVTTHEEAILCALAAESEYLHSEHENNNNTEYHNKEHNDKHGPHGFRHSKDGILRLVPTSLVVSTDYVRMLSVCSTKAGRIFLGGEDGCVHEMLYGGAGESYRPSNVVSNGSNNNTNIDDCLERFYDRGEMIPPILYENPTTVTGLLLATGKRAMSTVVFGRPQNGSDGGGHRSKCHKINHSSHASSLAGAVVPDFLLKATSYLFGTSGVAGGKIVRMVVDEERSCLYTLSSNGWICAFDLDTDGKGEYQNESGSNNNSSKLKLAAIIDISKTARMYLEALSRGQTHPPSAYSSKIGKIVFPGGAASAQAGIGGIAGARSILKSADLAGKTNRTLLPVSIHVITRKESSRLSLVAVTKGGLRYYLSSLSESALHSDPSYQSNNSPSRKNDALAPAGRFLFCHIRAPPPVFELGKKEYEAHDDASLKNNIGGYCPKFKNSRETDVQVNSCYYHQSRFVLALDQNGNTKKNNNFRATHAKSHGDIIVSMTPDIVERKKEIAEGSTSRENTSFVSPGGVSETISFPMATAYSSSDRVPGGMIWDIAHTEQTSCILNLASHSQTPSNLKLVAGLVPFFSPASKGPWRNAIAVKKGHSAVREMESSLHTSFSSIAINTILDLLLFRPRKKAGRHSHIPQGAKLEKNNYRLSKKYGYNGFSLTAANISPQNKKGSTAKSTRLNPMLLKPPVVPLAPLAVQHLLPSSQIVMLNGGGLHYFESVTILAQLADAIMAAGKNVDTNKHVTSFFRSYGNVEGCAMCLLLAIGCSSNNVGDALPALAARAALARAFVPQLVPLPATQDSGAIDRDPLLPGGYTYAPSELHRGLTAVISRLVRPIWHKPAVVVTEGRAIRQGWTSTSTITPAKVELLLNDTMLEEIRKPLCALQNLMKDMFPRAINTVPGMVEKKKHSFILIDFDKAEEQNQYITGAVSQHSRNKKASETALLGKLAPLDAEAIARLTEERKIHSLYRLVSRSVQLLTLLSILKRAHDVQELPEVEWGLLHGLTFSQLVQNRENQNRLESLLNSLVVSNKAINNLVKPSEEVDQLASQFADHCYLYFSPGSRFAYLGFRHANNALAQTIESAERKNCTKQAVQCFRQAVSHWHSATLITGSSQLCMQERKRYEAIARRAKLFDSPLAKTAEVLIQLGEVAAMVDICLICASNFCRTKSKETALLLKYDGNDKSSSKNIFPWEQDLYHKRRDTFDNDRSIGNGASLTPSSPSTNDVLLDGAVTSDDAIDTCHALVLHHLLILLQSDRVELSERMVSACAAVADESFLNAFFSHLYENEHTGTLLRINSTAVENWARDQTHDKHLLYRYFVVQGRQCQAGHVSWERAKDPNLKLGLNERIECLSRALNSFQMCKKENEPLPPSSPSSTLNSGGGVPEDGQIKPMDRTELDQSIISVKETIEVARIQNRILQAVEDKAASYNLSNEKYTCLSNSLVPISDLYNDYATDLSMYNICILIFHACKRNDDAIQKLWQSIICEVLLPCSTQNRVVYNFLTNFSKGCLVDEKVTMLTNDSDPSVAETSSLPLFENGDWLDKLKAIVVDLGKEVYGSGADYVFPINYIVASLDNLFRVLQGCKSPVLNHQSGTTELGSALQVLTNAGVPYLTTLEAYERTTDLDDQDWMGGVNPQKQKFDHTSTVVAFLKHWVTVAKAARDGKRSIEPFTQLVVAVRSRGLLEKLEFCKLALESIPAVGGVSSVFDKLEEVKKGIKELL